MAVMMESDGYRHVLRIEDNDVQSFERRLNGWEISFKSAVYTTSVISVADVSRDYVHKKELDDTSKYWRTEELVSQLKGMLEYQWACRDSYAKSANTISLAAKYHYRATALEEMVNGIEAGVGIWED